MKHTYHGMALKPSHAAHRTDKAKAELNARERLLTVRERGALFLADGSKSADQLRQLLQDTTGLVDKLIQEGYLALPAAAGRTSPAPAPRTVTPAELSSAEPSMTVLNKAVPDSFDGKRSLASTRMFLFDICERMFARKLPALADQYREELRQARDRVSMLRIADDMLQTVAEVAGQDRADGLSERIATLLPLEAEAL